MNRHTHKHKTGLHYNPRLGEHHMNWDKAHWRAPGYISLRNIGAFILSTEVAPAPNHTLIHRSMKETPKPIESEIEYMAEVARESGILAVVSTIDNRTTEHYRRQLFIAAIPPEEAIERLNKKQYLTQQELGTI